MAKLWGINTSDENKPSWLTTEEKENCYATQAGWVYKHPDGTEEVLVAIAGLAGVLKLAAASITNISFGNGTYTAGTTKTVRWNF